MGGDLISREKLIKDISYKFGLGDSIITNTLNVVKNQPAAFDVDKVMEKLDERIRNTGNCEIGFGAALAYVQAKKIIKSALNQ
ncbi:MAG: hypothetical protein HFI70_03970 [Lachnospiraceae bacterium]|nr:hypothetical protein [Lachnospiraceae bacterium]